MQKRLKEETKKRTRSRAVVGKKPSGLFGDLSLSRCSWKLIKKAIRKLVGFPGGTSGKEPACQRRRRKRLGFDLWVRKIPWRRKQQPTLVFLPGESHGQRKVHIQEDCDGTGETFRIRGLGFQVPVLPPHSSWVSANHFIPESVSSSVK